MFCPECRSEYVPGITHCADCLVDLVDELPGEAEDRPQRPAPEGEVSEVHRCHGETEAELLRSVLEANGIATALAGDALGSTVYRLTVGPLSEVAILVGRADAGRARSLIASALRGDLEAGGAPRSGGRHHEEDV
jgi:hypothetical protein